MASAYLGRIRTCRLRGIAKPLLMGDPETAPLRTGIGLVAFRSRECLHTFVVEVPIRPQRDVPLLLSQGGFLAGPSQPPGRSVPAG